MTDNLPLQPKGYKITRFNLVTQDDSDPTTKTDQINPKEGSVVDIRKICSGWNYIESIDSPSVRMEIAIFDTLDLISSLTGNEIIQLTIETDSSPGLELEVTQKIFKIGEITKSERAQLYVIYTVSPETINNETNKVFKSFKDDIGSAHVKTLVEEKLMSSGKKYSYEPTKGNFNFLAPTWRPYDCIAYISDKVVSSVTNTAGYVFYENKDGYYFHTIDWLCSNRNPSSKRPVKYTYEQANVGGSDLNAFKIETLNFPDRANHLEKMRSGSYSNTVLGLKLPALTSGNLPAAGDGDAPEDNPSDQKGASGSIQPPLHMGMSAVFGLAKKAEGILNEQFPYPKVKTIYFDDKRPTRTKVRALPGMKNAKTAQNSTGGAGNMDYDTVWASAYSFSRWQLLRAITLDITVPGNVALAVGQQLECVIPASTKEEERTMPDPIYSGIYLITGLTHKYNPEGVTTILNLSKDSITTPS